MPELEVVVAHQERATLRVGDTFLKIDVDPERTRFEAEVMRVVPIPTAEILWCEPPVLALGRVPGAALGHLGQPSPASAAAWTAAGAAVRRLHEAALPDWPGETLDEAASRLEAECAWLLAGDVLPRELVEHNRRLAERVLRPSAPVLTHGDLQVDHVFVDGDEVTGVLDWSEAGPGDALTDLASLTVGHRHRLDDVLAGYGAEVDREVLRGWWSMRCLTGIRWLVEHGFDPHAPGCEVDVLRSQR